LETPVAARSEYVIRGGQEGTRRLEILCRILWPSTFRLLKNAGLRPGMTCLDLGCGGGDVTRGIARMTGAEGRVVGVDMDAVKLDAASQAADSHGLRNLEFRQANVYEWFEESVYDLIYARFLLTHLPDCAGALAAMRRALKPAGVLVVEDIDFTGSFCYPRCPAYDRYVTLYREVVRRRNGDADIGPKLYGLLVDAGLEGVNLTLIHPFHISQEGKELSLSTLVNIAEAVLTESLAEPEDLRRTIDELDAFTRDPTTIVSLPRVFQAWGRRAA
jgi:2-polyprenyl-3-methyl-5-hydroxy-6-metoxy-1,4-benzoquinol methylase